MLSEWLATITAIATVIEPVGPDMRPLRAPEHGGEEADRYRPVHSRGGAQTRRQAERQCHRQTDYSRCDAAEDVPA